MKKQTIWRLFGKNRTGFTKPPLAKRKARRRAKAKFAKQQKRRRSK